MQILIFFLINITINRTIFGIETRILLPADYKFLHPINRTIFGIETMICQGTFHDFA